MLTAITNEPGCFGGFGGRFVPESLIAALDELDAQYAAARSDPTFAAELAGLHATFVGRPTPLYFASRLTAQLGGAKLYFKREDLAHTGAHKINNAVGQALLARRMNKQRVIAETAAGQHGVATAAACARLGLECAVYMGSQDMRRQRPNVLSMRLLGASVRPVETGSGSLKDAIDETLRDWAANVRSTHYLAGSVVGPHPLPRIVRDFQSVIGRETREQMLAVTGRLPDLVLACVGGGSNAIGMFHPFLGDRSVQLVGVEAGGRGLDSAEHAATLVAGRVGVLHGARSYVLQTDDGQVARTHSIAAGLDYPGVGPEHAWLKDSGRAEYTFSTDDEALDALHMTAAAEGIIPALEAAHAIAHAIKIAPLLSPDQTIVVCLSGRGDKDLDIVESAADR
jgi:tryptophan synthase beta chain